ncbi:MAG: extracellular catalytic domain type 1 short-chain-length polyhydroxyalkanoate depolymerase [Gammaproteobacteria bacterium]
MNDNIFAAIPEITQLTRAGRLQEATAAIQRSLGGYAAASNTTGPAERPEKAPFEGVFHVIDSCAIPSSRARHATPTSPGPQPEPVRAPREAPLGQFITGSYTNHAGTRAYKLYVPGGYREQPLPLVVMLHGCTQSPDDFAAGTRMNQLAEEERCLVLYPAQGQDANVSKCWNWFNACDQQREQGEPSIIAGITRQIMKSHRVDPRRVYVAGLSAGGAMAVTMGVTYPELYAATGVHSGLPYAAAHDMPSAFAALRQGKRTGTGSGNTTGVRAENVGGRGPDVSQPLAPTIVFHGDRDTTVNPCNGEQVIAQSQAQPANGSANSQSQTNARVTVQRGKVANGHAYTRTVYRDSSGDASAEHWLVHGAGHAWSGGSPTGSFTDPKGPDAAKEMIRFFLEHPRLARH